MRIIYNGELYDEHALILNANNRSFRYGDALFETIRFQNGRALYLEDHFERLYNGMHLLKMEIPEDFSVDFFNDLFKKIYAENNLTGAARIRLSVFRNGGGYYLPLENSVSFIIQSDRLENETYQWNENGKVVCIYDGDKKSLSAVSNYKTANAMIYVQAAMHAKQHRTDDCLILNQNGNICDSIHSNVFLVKGAKIITPALNEGCVDGIMRKQIIRHAFLNKLSVVFKPITIADLVSADEMFLTNVIRGIQWVERLEVKYYTAEFANILFGFLNDDISNLRQE